MTAVWQPIATAPRDRRILVWGEGRVFLVEAMKAGGGIRFMPSDGFCGSYSCLPPDVDATHWMELPEGPT